MVGEEQNEINMYITKSYFIQRKTQEIECKLW